MTTEPCPLARSAGVQAWVRTNTAVRLTSSARRHTSVPCSSNGVVQLGQRLGADQGGEVHERVDATRCASSTASATARVASSSARSHGTAKARAGTAPGRARRPRASHALGSTGRRPRRGHPAPPARRRRRGRCGRRRRSRPPSARSGRPARRRVRVLSSRRILAPVRSRRASRNSANARSVSVSMSRLRSAGTSTRDHPPIVERGRRFHVRRVDHERNGADVEHRRRVLAAVDPLAAARCTSRAAPVVVERAPC